MRQLHMHALGLLFLAVAVGCPCAAQEMSPDGSHRLLDGVGLDRDGAQLRLELLQRLQGIASARQAKGLPPIDPRRLSPEILEKIRQVQQSDKDLRAKLLQAQIERERAAQEEARRARARKGDVQTPRSETAPRDGSNPPPPTKTQQRLVQQLLKPFTGRSEPNRREPGRTRNLQPERRPGASPNGAMSERPGSEPRTGRDQLLTPSQRPLDDVENFDLADWMDRISKSGSRPRTPPSSSPGRTNAQTPRRNGTARRDPGSPATNPPATSQGRAKSGSFSKNTFKNLMKSAKAQGRAPKPSARASDTGSSGDNGGLGVFASAFEKTAEGVGQHVEDIIRHQQQRQRSGQSRSSRSSRQSSSLVKGLRRANRSTTRFFNQQSRRVSRPGSMSLPSAPTAGSLLPFAFGIAVVGVVWFLLRRSDEKTLATDIGPIVEARMPETIRGRQDVIDAFHYIAARTPQVKGNWWTHSRVAKVLAKVLPTRDAAVRELAQVYETARYLPPDAELTDDEIRTAREAIQRCSQ